MNRLDRLPRLGRGKGLFGGQRGLELVSWETQRFVGGRPFRVFLWILWEGAGGKIDSCLES